jgi:hypothetical protein
MRPTRLNPLAVALLACCSSGCIGFANGYMADRPPPEDDELARARRSAFPAVAADLHLMRHAGEKAKGPLGVPLFVAIVALDLPLSAAVDGIFLPFRAIGRALHPHAGEAPESDADDEAGPNSG